jgi:hypothetical protein
MKQRQLTVTILLFVFLLVTNRWIDYDDLPTVMDTPDVHDYMSIGVSAPNLPVKPMVFQRAQRFIVPFSLGIVASIAGIPTKTIFLLSTLLCCAVTLIIFQEILKTLNVNSYVYILCTALLLLNPYMFRFYLTLPGMISDLLFHVGVAVMLLGLLNGQPAIVFAALILAAVARQTALLLLPGVLLWVNLGDGWKERASRRKLIYSIGIVFSVVLIYQATAVIAAKFAYRNMNLTYITGLFSWVANSISARGCVQFLLRLVIPHVFAISILAAFGNQANRGKEFWFCVFLGISMIAQPLLAGPDISTGGVVRLSSFAYLPLLTALAVMAARNKIFDRASVIPFALLLIVIATASLHHVFTFIGATLLDAYSFAFFHLSLAFVAASICFFARPRTAQ